MPIVNNKPGSTPVPVTPQLPIASTDGYKGVAVDTRYTPLTSIVSYMSGTPWEVSAWFGQLLGQNSEVRPLDTAGVVVNQQYFAVMDLEIRVEQPLSSSWDSAIGQQTVTGSAMVLPFLTPNKYDYFVAEAGVGRMGLFQITEIERTTFNRTSAFRVDYTLVSFVDDDPTMLERLQAKVQRRYVFHRDRLVQGQEALLTTEDTDELFKLQGYLTQLQSYYLRTFYDPEHNTLMVPGQPEPTYDPYLTAFVLAMFELDEYQAARSIQQFGFDLHVIGSQPNLWSVLLARREDMLLDACRQYRAVPTTELVMDAALRPITYSRIDRVIYPIEQDLSVHSEPMTPTSYTTLSEPPQRRHASYNPATELLSDGVQSMPAIPVVTALDAYVLPVAWYETRQSSSMLEVLVRDYIRHTTIQPKLLGDICGSYMRWGRLEQYYYIPVLVMLLKTTIRELK